MNSTHAVNHERARLVAARPRRVVRPPRTSSTWARTGRAALCFVACALGGWPWPQWRPPPPSRQPKCTRSSKVSLTGAGSTFDAPFFAAAFTRYHKLDPAVSVNYAAVGSSLGIKHFSAGAMDFGASDVPMTANQQAEAQGGPVVQVPVDLGAVVVSYNPAPGTLGQPLRLTGAVLAGIYLGQITNWDDKAIAALNPHNALPDEKITVVHRSDGSGTTYIFTNYLSGPGTGTAVSWPVGLGAKKSAAVAAIVKILPGSLGYFELSYAESNLLPYAAIENQTGAFVPPFPGNVAPAAGMKADLSAADFSIVNEPGPQSYPISGYSWLLIYMRQSAAASGAALVQLVNWMPTPGKPSQKRTTTCRCRPSSKPWQVRPFRWSSGHRASDWSDEVAYTTDHDARNLVTTSKFFIARLTRRRCSELRAPVHREGAPVVGRLAPPNRLA